MQIVDEAIENCEKEAEEYESLIASNDDYNFSQLEWKQSLYEYKQLAKWLKELKELRLKDAKIKYAIHRCRMRELAQDETSGFEHRILKIYGVME